MSRATQFEKWRPAWRRLTGLRAVWALMSAAALAAAPEPVASGPELHAALILQLIHFVEWPAKQRGPEFPVCVVGNESLAAALRKTASGESAMGTPLTVRSTARLRETGDCRAIVVSAYDDRQLRSFLGGLQDAPVLTVGDSEAFLRLGGAVSLTLEKGRIGIQVNLASAERAHLRFSSKLLRLARVVQGEGL